MTAPGADTLTARTVDAPRPAPIVQVHTTTFRYIATRLRRKDIAPHCVRRESPPRMLPASARPQPSRPADRTPRRRKPWRPQHPSRQTSATGSCSAKPSSLSAAAPVLGSTRPRRGRRRRPRRPRSRLSRTCRRRGRRPEHRRLRRNRFRPPRPVLRGATGPDRSRVRHCRRQLLRPAGRPGLHPGPPPD
jgi:hypothetical protein